MGITGETRINDLLSEHPFLEDFLSRYHPLFRRIASPVLRRTVGRFATLSGAAEMAGVPVDTLVADVSAEITRHAVAGIHSASGSAPEASAVPATASDDDAHGGLELQAALKSIIHDLHDGAPIADVKARFEALTKEVDAQEIARMEQALIAEGLPVEEVTRLCDVHVSVFKEALEEQPPGDATPGHPVHTYRLENQAQARIVSEIRDALVVLEQSPLSARGSALAAVGAQLARLAEVDTHYTRKENQLFPLLEKHGVSGPTQVMWGIHDDIRARLKRDRAAVDAGDAEEVLASLPDTLGMLDDMVYKEEKILFPVALETLSADEWSAMRAGEDAIGFAWIEPAEALAGWPASAGEDRESPGAATASGAEGVTLPLSVGALTPKQIDLMLRALPFDITFVDSHARVRYYSEGRERIFPRSPAVIGREVRNCHPPKSVHVVERIVKEFATGGRDVAEFWIERDGRLVFIRYFAVRDEDDAFEGVLEVTQDVTEIRALEGERRLLDW